MRKLIRSGLLAVAGLGTMLAIGATPAFAGTITQPTGTATNPFVVPECTSSDVSTCDNAVGELQAGSPEAFTISGSGWTPNTTVFIEVCDGTDVTGVNWDPTLNCDIATTPAPQIVPASGDVTFTPTGPPGYNADIGVFRGESPEDLFNCLAPGDDPHSTTTLNGEPIDPSRPSFTNCKVRMTTNQAAAASGDAYLPISIPNAPASQTPEVPYAIILPPAGLGVLGAGVLFARRRHRAQSRVAA